MAENLTQWEYTTTPVPRDGQTVYDLDKLGKEGWEVIGVLAQNGGKSTDLFLKRPIRT